MIYLPAFYLHQHKSLNLCKKLNFYKNNFKSIPRKSRIAHPKDSSAYGACFSSSQLEKKM